MKLLKFLTVFGIFALITLTLFADQSARIGENAPDFNLKDSYGKSHKLSDFKGKYIILEWINFDCPFVVKHYKSENMQKLQKEMTGKGIVWLSICSSAEGKQGHFANDEINKRIKDLKAKMTAYLIDEDGTVGKMYAAKVTPHIFIINPQGKLIYQGAIDDIKSTDIADIEKAKNYLKTAIEEATGGKSITSPTTTPYGCSVKYK